MKVRNIKMPANQLQLKNKLAAQRAQKIKIPPQERREPRITAEEVRKEAKKLQGAADLPSFRKTFVADNIKEFDKMLTIVSDDEKNARIILIKCCSLEFN